jgi:hypothetical protein
MRCAGANATHTGWGDASYAVGAFMEDSTARPKAAFTADSQGTHRHQLNSALETVNPQWLENRRNGKFHNRSGMACEETNLYGFTTDGNFITETGAHTHTITGGGDVETRPKTFLVEMIIKAFDQTITLVA